MLLCRGRSVLNDLDVMLLLREAVSVVLGVPVVE